MRKKRTLTKLIVGICLSLALLITSAHMASADNRELTGLIELSNHVAHVGDVLVFSVSYGSSLYTGLQHSRISSVRWNLGDGTVITNSDLQAVVYSYDQPGTYFVEVTVTFETVNGTPSNNTISSREKLIIERSGRSVSFGSGSSADVIVTFDANADDRLSNSEFFMVVDAWVRGEVNNSAFFDAVDLWISEGSILSLSSASALEFNPQAMRTASDAIVFSAGTQSAAQVSVRISDSTGAFITKRTGAGDQLSWRPLDAQGTPLANGVYFYSLSTYNADGKLTNSTLKPFYIMR